MSARAQARWARAGGRADQGASAPPALSHTPTRVTYSARHPVPEQQQQQQQQQEGGAGGETDVDMDAHRRVRECGSAGLGQMLDQGGVRACMLVHP